MPKEYTYDEVAPHKSDKSCWCIIEGGVYDLTKFLDDHPGGADTILDTAGGDATTQFEAVGHSNNAREMMKKYYIGVVKGEPGVKGGKGGAGGGSGSGGSGLILMALVGVIVAGLGYYAVSSGMLGK